MGTVKPVQLNDEAKDKGGNPVTERVYVSVDGGMSDNIRPALYGSDYTARIANRKGSDETKLCRVVGMHCESGDIVVNEVRLPPTSSVATSSRCRSPARTAARWPATTTRR